MDFGVWSALGSAGALLLMSVAESGPDATEPLQEGSPDSDEAVRTGLRAAHKLKLVPAENEGSDVSELPGGVYGFTYTPGMSVAPVFRNHAYQSFELHKLSDGSVWYVGYLSPQQVRALETTSLAIELDLYPEPYQQATEIVAIPRNRVIHAKERPSREDGNAQRLSIGPRED